MSKKKARKAARKVTAPPPKVEDVDTITAAAENQNIESDAPPVARRSTEVDNGSLTGDVERLDE